MLTDSFLRGIDCFCAMYGLITHRCGIEVVKLTIFITQAA